MANNNYLLDEMQSLMLMSGILKLKENPYFRDDISKKYQKLYIEKIALRSVKTNIKQS